MVGGAFTLSAVALVAGAPGSYAVIDNAAQPCFSVHIYDNGDPGGLWIDTAGCSTTVKAKIRYAYWPDACYTVAPNTITTGIKVRPGPSGYYTGYFYC